MEGQQQSFQPNAEHAVPAQQEEITRLRSKHAVDLAEAWDRNVYLAACMHQMQEEARTEIGRLHGEISVLRTELAEHQEHIGEHVPPRQVEGEATDANPDPTAE